MGYESYTVSGERTYNKFLHALRKMYIPKSKPSDIGFAGLTYDKINLNLIELQGAFLVLSGILILIGQNAIGSFLLILASAFMMATKDNIGLKSDVSAIRREEP